MKRFNKIDNAVDKLYHQMALTAGVIMSRVLRLTPTLGERYAFVYGCLTGFIMGILVLMIIALLMDLIITYLNQVLILLAALVFVAVGIVLIKWYLRRSKIPYIHEYINMLHGNVGQITYDNHTSMPPIRQPLYPSDIEGKLLDNHTYLLLIQKLISSTLTMETVENYCSLFQYLLDRRLFPKDIYGNYIQNPLYLSGIVFDVDCEDAGRFFKVKIRINTRVEKMSETKTNAGATSVKLEDDEV